MGSLTAAVPQPTGFPTLGYFDDNSSGALKWKDLLVNTIYQVRSARSIHTQHGTTFILSLETADGFWYNAWACGMLTKELLQNPSMLEDKQQLRMFIRPTGPKTSKNGRVCHSYQLLQCKNPTKTSDSLIVSIACILFHTQTVEKRLTKK